MDSNNIFPNLPGLKWDVMMTPIFETNVILSQSGRENRVPAYIYPRWQFSLSYDLLRDYSPYTEFRTLLAFYLQQQGAATSFLYSCPWDQRVLSQAIGTGDGHTTSFQLLSGNLGGWVQPITDVDSTGSFNVYLAGVLQSPSAYSYAQFQSGLVTFNSAPGSGVAITMDFSYYYRVRFTEWQENKSSGGGNDGFSQFAYNFWELKSVSFITAR